MTTYDVFADLDLSRTRLVRHALDQPRLALRYPEAFAAFQQIQVAGKFGDARHLVSFVPDGGTAVRFVGAWDVRGSRPGHELTDDEVDRFAAAERRLGRTVTREHIRTVWRTATISCYDLSPVRRYDPLVGDLVVDWGPGARAWVQRADRRPKAVL